MGRAERRKQERINRLESRKDKILMSHDDISALKHEVGEYKTEVLLTSFMLANHRLWGHGAKRIFKTLHLVDQLSEDVLSGKATMEDYIQELKEDAGVIIKADGRLDENEF